MTANRHVNDRLDEWLDGRLSAAEESEVDRHLEACDSCRAEAAALRAVQAAVAVSDDDVELPAGLEDRIRGMLDAEDAAARERVRSPGAAVEQAPDAPRRSPATIPPGSRRSRRLTTWALPLAAGLLLAVAAAFWAMRTETVAEPVGEAFAQFEELTGASETWRTAQVDGAGELEERWRAAGLGFRTRVIDLSMSAHALAGGRATRLGGRPAALAIYRGPSGLVTCWMFDASEPLEEDFPEPADVHEANGFRFHVFEREGVTLVVWREGDVLCALAGSMDRDAVVELAHAKAMAPPLA